MKISNQDTATSDIKQDVELIREDINKGNNQVKKSNEYKNKMVVIRGVAGKKILGGPDLVMMTS